MKLYTRQIIPEPFSSESRPGQFLLNMENKLLVGCSTLDGKQKYELQGLWNRFTCGAGKIVFEDSCGMNAFCGVMGEAVCEPCPASEKYVLCITENGISIAANDTQGFIYAFYTLLQLIIPTRENQFLLPCVKVTDRPALTVRMIHFCVFPETDLMLIEKAIRLAGFLKFTHVILEFWGTFRYECMKELSWPEYSYTAEELKPLIDLIRSLGMEPVPMLNHLGHAAQARECFGRHVVLDQNPAKALLFEPDGWTWCVTNPESLELLRKMREELTALFGPGEFFHLGCDESRSFASCCYCREHEQHELFASYLNSITEELAAAGRRPIIWGDQLLEKEKWQNIGVKLDLSQTKGQTTHLAIPRLDKRIIIADWQYSADVPNLPSSLFFKEQGFDVLTAPWDKPSNIHALAQTAKDNALFGMLATTWDHLPRYVYKMDVSATAGWCGKEVEYNCLSTEMASIVRRIMPYPHEYRRCGWNSYEISE